MKRSAPLAFGLFCLLAGCRDDAPPTMYCPNVAVLQQASVLNAYLPGRTDVAAQITSATVTGVAGSCASFKKNTMLRVTFRPGFTATNGPANAGKKLDLPYFVSLSQSDTIISKTPYDITMDFGDNLVTTTATAKPVTVELANVPQSANLDVLVGFQLTPTEMSDAGGAAPQVP